VRSFKGDEERSNGQKIKYLEEVEELFHKFFNEGRGISLNSNKPNGTKEDQDYSYYHKIGESEAKEAPNRITKGEAIWLDFLPIDMWKDLGEKRK
jgi:hypothetical protein